MLKKTALSLFGLAVMLICSIRRRLMPAWWFRSALCIRVRFMFVRTGMSRPCLTSLTVRILTFMRRRMFVRAGDIVRASTPRVTFRGMSIACSWNAVRTGGGNSS